MSEEKKIADYAMIGDGEAAALVHRSGAIEWCCLPRFDSDACFAAMLGDAENGCWRMRPAGEVTRTSRSYMGDTLILETVFETEEGEAAVIDFMPIRGEAPDIVRIVEGRRGKVEMVSELALRFDYGRTHPLVQTISDVRWVAIVGPDAIALDFDVAIDFQDRWFTSRFTVEPGDKRAFVMTWFASYVDIPERVNPADALKDTHAYWHKWASGIDYEGPYRDVVMRSLLTLKGMVHQPTGGIVAAPTASLPERPGGTRNWDYRFCWLRDATFTLLALQQAGLTEEAAGWIEWLRRAVGGEPIDIQPFYTVGGDRRMIEWEAHWLAGFNGAAPVRFGNGAADQLQLDIYGEVIDALFRARKKGIGHEDDMAALARLIVEKLVELWDQPDAGIWESRGGPRHHTYSKVMCWVAFDRAARWFCDDADSARRYRELADRIHALVCREGYDEERRTFTAAFGEPALDAATLRMPLVGFIKPDDPRMVGTVAAIEQGLVRDGLVYRYDPSHVDDGVGGAEGSFLAACYWLVDVYALQDRFDDATALFDRTTALANDLGLLSEEATPGLQLGNFPQALSHLSQIVAAMTLTHAHNPSQERSD